MAERTKSSMWSGLLTTVAVVICVSLTLWADLAVCRAIGSGDGPGKAFAFISKAIAVVGISLLGAAVTLVILFAGLVGPLLGAKRDRREAASRLMREVERAERESR
ncbi:MAG: hypothetical protein QM783_00085 [Phycisphaerales bacterium]